MTPTDPRRRLPGTVLWLGVVSFLTDASSELIYPLLPKFLSAVLGASPEALGLIEGVAETTASLMKLASGRIADAVKQRKPLTVIGYGLSSLARPLVAIAWAPWWVGVVRFTDRIGKGIRGSPRDAIVADVTPADRRGAAYGYHRAMDNGGAVIGPLVGFVLLAGLKWDLRTIFACAAVPATAAMLSLVFGVKEPPRSPTGTGTRTGAGAGAGAGDGAALARYLVALAFFTLSNASDAFLLLRASDLGLPEAYVLLVWTLHNGTKSLLNRGFGALSDRVGRRWLIGIGWLVYAATYLGFGYARAAWQVWPLFVAYGVYYALVEGSERALVADLAGPARRGMAFGWFNAVTGLLALPASLGFGWLYKTRGASTAFVVAAALAAAAVLALVALVPARKPPRAASTG